MKKHDDYVSGPHDFWTHFVCGFIFGALAGTVMGWTLFENIWLTAASALGLAMFFAFANPLITRFI